MKKILILIDNISRAKFFDRLVSGLEEINVSPVSAITFVTGRYSCYKFLKKAGRDVEIIKKRKSRGRKEFIQKEAMSTLEFLRGDLDENQADRYYNSASIKASELVEKHDVLMLWNGNQLVEKAFSNKFKERSKAVYFFEIGNFPGKVFVDGQGVNASSCIAKDPSVLDEPRYDVSNEVYKKWLQNYYDYKKNNNLVPQSIDATKIPYERLLDYFFDKLGLGLYAINIQQAVNKLVNKKRCKKYIKSNFMAECFLPEDFVFYPLQVSSDTQLLLNSEVDNIDAIYKSYEIAKSHGVPLVIKFHPAENSIDFYKKLKPIILGMDGLIIYDGNTSAVVKKANSVVTINSTVGLEALIEGKALHVLGRAHYESFIAHEGRLKKYICGYLFDINYFADDVISKKVLNDFWVDMVLK